MRDLVAIVVVMVLVVAALRMATSLQWHKRDNLKARRALLERGHTIIAEIPGGTGLRLFTEDPAAYYWENTTIPKSDIRAVRVLISGAPLSVRTSTRFSPASSAPDGEQPGVTQFEAFGRDRWDVAVDHGNDTVLVECGAIRERVSQDLARLVFETISAEIARRDEPSPPAQTS
jgi:hypothetical protein